MELDLLLLFLHETLAIKEVFGDHAYKLNISSTKSMRKIGKEDQVGYTIELFI